MASELENRGTYTDLDRPDDVVTYQKSFSQTKIVLAISIVTVFVISLVIIGVVVGVFASDNDTKPKNIIVVLADGLSPSSLTYAREMSTFNSANPAPLLPIDQYLSGHVRVYSANLVITDSAAGATAYSCQKLTNNDFVAVTPDGIACATLLEAAKEAGFVTGIVTNTRVTHATPAAFSAHVPARDFEDTIAQQQAYNFSQSLDLLYGGGLSKFVDNNGENLLDVFAEEGVNVITSVDELESAKLPVVGLFADSHLAYQIDLMQMDPPPEPTLSELVENALDLLSSDDKPFFLFIESGKIDLSAHSNDAPTHYWEVNQYMQVVQTIEDFLSSTKKDTSVVFVSDHATGGITTGRRYDNLSYPEYTWFPEVILRVNSSLDQIIDRVNDNEGTLEEIYLEYTGLDLNDFPTQYELIQEFEPQTTNEYESLLADPLNSEALIGFTTIGHTGVDINLYKAGVDIKDIGGILNNFEVGRIISRTMGLDSHVADLNQKYETWQFDLPEDNPSTRMSRRKFHG